MMAVFVFSKNEPQLENFSQKHLIVFQQVFSSLWTFQTANIPKQHFSKNKWLTLHRIVSLWSIFDLIYLILSRAFLTTYVKTACQYCWERFHSRLFLLYSFICVNVDWSIYSRSNIRCSIIIIQWWRSFKTHNRMWIRSERQRQKSLFFSLWGNFPSLPYTSK